MKFSEAADGVVEGFIKLPEEKKAQLAVTVAVAMLLAGRTPFGVAWVVAMVAGAAAGRGTRMLADMHDLTVKQAAYLMALEGKAAGDAAGGV